MRNGVSSSSIRVSSHSSSMKASKVASPKEAPWPLPETAARSGCILWYGARPSGLGNARARRRGSRQLPAAIGETITFVSIAVWATLIVLYVLKWAVAREEALKEVAHPVQCCFIGLSASPPCWWLAVCCPILASALKPCSSLSHLYAGLLSLENRRSLAGRAGCHRHDRRALSAKCGR